MNERKEELKENEQYLSTREDIEIEVSIPEAEPVIYVKFSGFEDHDDAGEYAEFLAENLPLLLLQTIRVQ